MNELIKGTIPVAERLPGTDYLVKTYRGYIVATWVLEPGMIREGFPPHWWPELPEKDIIGCIPLSALVPRSALDAALAEVERLSQCQWEEERCCGPELRAEVERLRKLAREPVGWVRPVIPDGFGFCPECGVQQYDEDGCCVLCGATATGAAVDQLAGREVNKK